MNEQANTAVEESVSVQLDRLVPEWARLLQALKSDITDDMRPDECGEGYPGMQVTIGVSVDEETGEVSWSYQTGDNSYTGGAYGHPYWGVVSLYRRSKSRELAQEAANEIADAIASSAA